MSKDDRNTAIIVAVVLVVCTISLIVIGGYLWKLIAPGLNSTFGSLSVFVRVNNTNYNFIVPKVSAASVNPPAFQLPDGYTYNFRVPSAPSTLPRAKITGIADQSVLRDARNQGYGNATQLTQADGAISIPLIGVSASVYAGNVGTELNQGFWEYPKGDRRIFLCQRQYFAVDDQRSCWDLDRLQVGNEIFLNRGDTKLRYVVKNINILSNVSQDNVYAGSEDLQDIQLITSYPLENGRDRLIITAQPQPAN